MPTYSLELYAVSNVCLFLHPASPLHNLIAELTLLES